jgi:beta-N-acetylhexosaminidase
MAAVTAGGSGPAGSATQPSLARMVGQLMLVRMQGTTPSVGFLARVRSGQIGGVVLFADNYGSAGPAVLITTLQRAAANGGQPRLLIAIDQEGGLVRRLPGAPKLAPRQMTSDTIARAEGIATALNLRRYGINVDLAPVLDIGHGGFVTIRTFGRTPLQVATRGGAFAGGLAAGGVVATGKHFPGLGYAGSNTDNAPTIVRASIPQLNADLLPYRTAIPAGLKVVMVSTAIYTALGAGLPAACSSRVVTQLLRRDLGFRGVVITDDLKTAGVNEYLSTPRAAVAAVNAGVDMVLAAGVTGRFADRTSEAAYRAILRAAQRGELPRSKVARAYQRVLALKRTVG